MEGFPPPHFEFSRSLPSPLPPPPSDFPPCMVGLIGDVPIFRIETFETVYDQKLVAIFDNGEGMTYEGLKAFATYFLSQSDRGLEKDDVEPVPAYLDGFISKFGVGATQAVRSQLNITLNPFTHDRAKSKIAIAQNDATYPGTFS